MSGKKICIHFLRWRGNWTVGQAVRKLGKIQFFTEPRCNGFTGWKLDSAVIWPDDDRLFEADGFADIMRAFRAKSAAHDGQVAKI